jgi:flagellar biosynthesis/type III secretory pathway protein FliH
MENKTKGYLEKMLKGYEEGYEQMLEFIDQTETQLSGAKESMKEVTEYIKELKGILGVEEEVVPKTKKL